MRLSPLPLPASLNLPELHCTFHSIGLWLWYMPHWHYLLFFFFWTLSIVQFSDEDGVSDAASTLVFRQEKQLLWWTPWVQLLSVTEVWYFGSLDKARSPKKKTKIMPVDYTLVVFSTSHELQPYCPYRQQNQRRKYHKCAKRKGSHIEEAHEPIAKKKKSLVTRAGWFELIGANTLHRRQP